MSGRKTKTNKSRQNKNKQNNAPSVPNCGFSNWGYIVTGFKKQNGDNWTEMFLRTDQPDKLNTFSILKRKLKMEKQKNSEFSYYFYKDDEQQQQAEYVSIQKTNEKNTLKFFGKKKKYLFRVDHIWAKMTSGVNQTWIRSTLYFKLGSDNKMEKVGALLDEHTSVEKSAFFGFIKKDLTLVTTLTDDINDPDVVSINNVSFVQVDNGQISILVSSSSEGPFYLGRKDNKMDYKLLKKQSINTKWCPFQTSSFPVTTTTRKSGMEGKVDKVGRTPTDNKKTTDLPQQQFMIFNTDGLTNICPMVADFDAKTGKFVDKKNEYCPNGTLWNLQQHEDQDKFHVFTRTKNNEKWYWSYTKESKKLRIIKSNTPPENPTGFHIEKADDNTTFKIKNHDNKFLSFRKQNFVFHTNKKEKVFGNFAPKSVRLSLERFQFTQDSLYKTDKILGENTYKFITELFQTQTKEVDRIRSSWKLLVPQSVRKKDAYAHLKNRFPVYFEEPQLDRCKIDVREQLEKTTGKKWVERKKWDPKLRYGILAWTPVKDNKFLRLPEGAYVVHVWGVNTANGDVDHEYVFSKTQLQETKYKELLDITFQIITEACREVLNQQIEEKKKDAIVVLRCTKIGLGVWAKNLNQKQKTQMEKHFEKQLKKIVKSFEGKVEVRHPVYPKNRTSIFVHKKGKNEQVESEDNHDPFGRSDQVVGNNKVLLLVNAWDNGSFIGNGAREDNTLDGWMVAGGSPNFHTSTIPTKVDNTLKLGHQFINASYLHNHFFHDFRRHTRVF